MQASILVSVLIGLAKSDEYSEYHITYQLGCYAQTCGQTVTGRQLTYEKALKIVQKEVYLNSVSIDNIPEHLKKRQLGVTFMDFLVVPLYPRFVLNLQLLT